MIIDWLNHRLDNNDFYLSSAKVVDGDGNYHKFVEWLDTVSGQIKIWNEGLKIIKRPIKVIFDSPQLQKRFDEFVKVNCEPEPIPEQEKKK